ncbi:MAG: N,N-dimethylformamidase [Rhodospirillaceae bacterium]|jgi:N,N-dimethylformamidase|nr:N,N-dimethylformamidase [Rhodospirillaceae bacterium]MBT6510592.1 N,N-dimethylformamidase [Rhodospirillaceae bacterium]
MKKIMGYCSDWSVMPGDTLNVMVSTYGPDRYRANLVRVICGNDDPDLDIYREEEIAAPFAGEYPGHEQITVSGSYVTIPSSPLVSGLGSFTVQAWVFPTTPEKGVQGLISNWDDATTSGFALTIDDSGAAAMRLGDGSGGTKEVATGKPMAKRRWHLVTAAYDAAAAALTVSQDFIGPQFEVRTSASTTVVVDFTPAMGSAQPLIMAAMPATHPAGRPGASHFFNGKLDRPRLVGSALSLADSTALGWDALPHERDMSVVAAWDFSHEIGSATIMDASPNGLHGRVVNLPSRAVKGFNWSGTEQNWRSAPQEYGAIHFHDDDLYDAEWDTDFTYEIPADLRSGVYAVRLAADDDEWYVTFYVRPKGGTATAKLAFLASTATYMAYSNIQWTWHEHFGEVAECYWTTMEPGEVFLQEHPEYGLSTYDNHSDGSGVRYASRLRPVHQVGPKTAPVWNINNDSHILGWLENKGIEYDVITDEDLHNEGVALLEQYSAVVTGAHPEYYTTPMRDGLRSYLARGGRMAYLGGNGFIWRCAMSDAMPGVIELRRAEDGIRYRDEEPGEYYMEFNGEYGGLWRRLGLAPQALCGVGTVAVGFDVSGYYIRKEASFDARAGFIFEGIGDDEVIGDFGYFAGGASGTEIDAADPMLGTPPHTLILASSEGHSANTKIVPDEIGLNHAALGGDLNPNVRADMTFFETPGGGAVFSVGSIAWPGSLPHNGYDNNVSRICENVLGRFVDDTPFAMPDG